MKKWIALIPLLLLLLLSTASAADLYSDLAEKVDPYNRNVDKVPGPIKSIFGNEEILGVINLTDGSTLQVRAVTKDARVVEFGKLGARIVEGLGDCNNDGNITALDALCVLKMSVGKMEENNKLDVDQNSKINSLDAKIILQSAVNLSIEAHPSLLVKTDENTVRSIMESEKPVDTFLKAVDSGSMKIEAVEVFKSIITSITILIVKFVKAIGII